MTQDRFLELCELAADGRATSAEALELERLCQENPEWMDEWLDYRAPLEVLAYGELPTASADFQATTMARIRADRLRRSAAYWAPSAIAAVAACIGFLVLLQALGHKPGTPSFDNPNAEASLERTTSIPIPDLQESLGR